MTFDTYYSDHPWNNIDKNQRQWYDPDLVQMFRQKSVFAPAITFAKQMQSVNAKTMTITQLMDPHPDTTALGLRQIWAPAAHIDSRSVDITFSRHGGKVAYLEYDDIVTYWRQNGTQGLRRILQGALGQHMMDVLDLLARNAFVKGALDSGYVLYQGGGSDFTALASGDEFELEIAMDIWLGMANRDVPQALGATGAAGSIVCFTTPGVIYDIQAQVGSDEWISLHQYTNTVPLLQYEVGSYKNVRFVQTPRCMLYNAGVIIARGEITVAARAGEGAPAAGTKVDGVYTVGQSASPTGADSALANRLSVTWTTGAWANINVNDIVTIHKTTSAAYGIVDGVDPFEGTAHYRRVVGKDAGNGYLYLDKPLMMDFTTDLTGGGVYGYVTKATHVHSSIFVANRTGIVTGVGRPPRVHTPRPVDDFDQVWRFSWDAFIGHNTYAPEVFEVVLSTGSFRQKGARVIQAG